MADKQYQQYIKHRQYVHLKKNILCTLPLIIYPAQAAIDEVLPFLILTM